MEGHAGGWRRLAGIRLVRGIPQVRADELDLSCQAWLGIRGSGRGTGALALAGRAWLALDAGGRDALPVAPQVGELALPVWQIRWEAGLLRFRIVPGPFPNERLFL